MPGKIFISYRRGDVPDAAARIRDRLTAAMGPGSVFIDVDNLRPGERFDRKLMQTLGECDTLLAVIGPRWLPLLTERLQRNEADFVRLEIFAALSKGMPVVPVLVGSPACRRRKCSRKISANSFSIKNTM